MHGFPEIMLCRLVTVENDGILSRKMDNWVRVGIKNAIALFQTQSSLETRVILVQNPTKSCALNKLTELHLAGYVGIITMQCLGLCHRNDGNATTYSTKTGRTIT